MEVLIYALGIVMFFEGAPYLLFPGKAKEAMLLILQMPDSALRLIGGILVCIGFILLYFL